MTSGIGMVCNMTASGPIVRIVQINIRGARHLYDVDTDCGTIEVAADTRTQAGKIAEDCGFALRDVRQVH